MIYGPEELSAKGWRIIPAIFKVALYLIVRELPTTSFNIEIYPLDNHGAPNYFGVRVSKFFKIVIVSYSEHSREALERHAEEIDRELRGNPYMKMIAFPDSRTTHVQKMSWPTKDECRKNVSKIVDHMREVLNATSRVQQPPV
jgi:hypothetical protein